jgi:hypothetical protein
MMTFLIALVSLAVGVVIGWLWADYDWRKVIERAGL